MPHFNVAPRLLNDLTQRPVSHTEGRGQALDVPLITSARKCNVVRRLASRFFRSNLYGLPVLPLYFVTSPNASSEQGMLLLADACPRI
jgi:hypothetical protein